MKASKIKSEALTLMAVVIKLYYILKSENCKTVFIQTPEDCLTGHSIFTQTIWEKTKFKLEFCLMTQNE